MVVPVTVVEYDHCKRQNPPYRSLDVHESPSSGYESFSGTPEAHEHQASTRHSHHHYDASAQSHEQHHRALPELRLIHDLKRPGSPTTVGRTPGHPHPQCSRRQLRIQAEQVQRVGARPPDPSCCARV